VYKVGVTPDMRHLGGFALFGVMPFM